jgi:hypothetical protein
MYLQSRMGNIFFDIMKPTIRQFHKSLSNLRQWSGNT